MGDEPEESMFKKYVREPTPKYAMYNGSPYVEAAYTQYVKMPKEKIYVEKDKVKKDVYVKPAGAVVYQSKANGKVYHKYVPAKKLPPINDFGEIEEELPAQQTDSNDTLYKA